MKREILWNKNLNIQKRCLTISSYNVNKSGKCVEKYFQYYAREFAMLIQEKQESN